MSYFEKFPITSYENASGERSGVKDVIRRAVFTDESLLQRSNFELYNISLI